LEWLGAIIGMRTGMPIAQLRDYTALVKQGSATLKERRALLAAHQTRLRDNITRWSEALALIDAKVEFYDEWVANGKRPAVEPHRRHRSSKKWRPRS